MCLTIVLGHLVTIIFIGFGNARDNNLVKQAEYK